MTHVADHDLSLRIRRRRRRRRRLAEPSRRRSAPPVAEPPASAVAPDMNATRWSRSTLQPADDGGGAPVATRSARATSSSSSRSSSIVAAVFGFDMIRTWWETNQWRRDARRRRRETALTSYPRTVPTVLWPCPRSIPSFRTGFLRRSASRPARRRSAGRAIRERRHTLIAAPTGSGKTLAAFLTAHRRPRAGSDSPARCPTRSASSTSRR